MIPEFIHPYLSLFWPFPGGGCRYYYDETDSIECDITNRVDSAGPSTVEIIFYPIFHSHYREKNKTKEQRRNLKMADWNLNLDSMSKDSIKSANNLFIHWVCFPLEDRYLGRWPAPPSPSSWIIKIQSLSGCTCDMEGQGLIIVKLLVRIHQLLTSLPTTHDAWWWWWWAMIWGTRYRARLMLLLISKVAAIRCYKIIESLQSKYTFVAHSR